MNSSDDDRELLLNVRSYRTMPHIKQESVGPRWPYDMRPSARAEKYMCVIVIR